MMLNDPFEVNVRLRPRHYAEVRFEMFCNQLINISPDAPKSRCSDVPTSRRPDVTNRIIPCRNFARCSAGELRKIVPSLAQSMDGNADYVRRNSPIGELLMVGNPRPPCRIRLALGSTGWIPTEYRCAPSTPGIALQRKASATSQHMQRF